MATVQDIVNRAFRKIGVKAEDENLTADQAQAGVDALNMMVAAWPRMGIPAYMAPVEVGDDFPLDDWTHEAVVYCLAARLAPDYGQAGPDDARYLQMLRAGFADPAKLAMPTTLLRMPSQFGRYRSD